MKWVLSVDDMDLAILVTNQLLAEDSKEWSYIPAGTQP